jgi:F0F1-type ATP synthase assembly protein I
MVISWWKEGLGGIISIASLLAFYVWHFFTAKEFPEGFGFILFALPSLLFLLTAILIKRNIPSS